MDIVWPDLPAPREEMDEEGADMPRVRIDTTTVKTEGLYWHDEWDIVHLVRPHNAGYTMCHRWVRVNIIHGVQCTGFTDDTPNCLLCMVIER